MADYAHLARLAYVSRPCVAQIIDLLLLASDIQEAPLFLPRADGGGAVGERPVRRICAVADWAEQRRGWRERASSVRASRSAAPRIP